MIDWLIASLLEFGEIRSEYISWHEKPPIYAQAPDLSAKLTEADAVAKKNPIAAITLYRKIIMESTASNGDFREQAIDRLLDTYESVTERIILDAQAQNRGFIGQALKFYIGVTESSNVDNNLVAKAYVKWGSLILKIEDPIYFFEAEEKLNEAYKRDNKKIKAEAAWHLGYIHYYRTLSIGGSYPKERKTNLLIARRYFKEVLGLDPNGKYAKSARNMLRLDELRNPNKFIY